MIEPDYKPNPVIDPTIAINVGTEEKPQELQIGSTLSEEEAAQFTSLLREFKDVFAWSYKDMPGINRDIAEHKIPIKPGFKPVKHPANKSTVGSALNGP